MMSSPIRFLWNLNTKRPRVYLSNILNFNFKKAYVIYRYRLLYSTLVPGMMSVRVIVCEIWSLVYFHLWPSSSVKVTFIIIIRWTLYCCLMVPSTKFVGSIEIEKWTIIWIRMKWRHNDVITHSIFMKFKHKTTKGISKRHAEFQFDQTWDSWDTK